MGLLQMGAGEEIRADMTAPLRVLVFPFLELILVTGLAWIAIGWCDARAVDPFVRNALVLAWAALVAWRFLVPVYRARRRRFIVTDCRIISRDGGKVDSIPLADVRGARRRRGGIALAIHGYERAMFFPNVPKAKRVEELINEPAFY